MAPEKLLIVVFVVLGFVNTQWVASEGTNPVVALLLNLAGFGTAGAGSHAGECPKITINPSSRLFYVENIGNDFTPGNPRHLRAANIQRHLASTSVTNSQERLWRHPVAKRAAKVRPVTVDKYLDAYVYNSPTDGAPGHRCGIFCSEDKSCGVRRKCCKTPCGYACYNAVYNLTAHLKS